MTLVATNSPIFSSVFNISHKRSARIKKLVVVVVLGIVVDVVDVAVVVFIIVNVVHIFDVVIVDPRNLPLTFAQILVINR